jgi:zinc transport system ATP-binding protein
MNVEVVALEDVWVYYDGLTVLEGVNLSIYEHDFLGIIGPNGGGKTTLLKVILGLVAPSKGRVMVLGGPSKKNRRFIGYVPQHSQFDREFPVNVWDVVLMGRLGHSERFRGFSEEDKRIAADVLKTVGMFELRDRQVGMLSGGETQRLFIARALASQPRLLLLDEPAASIDKPTETGLYDLLDELSRRITIVLVSHDISAVSVHVGKIACLNRRLYYHGSKEITAETLEEVYRCPVDIVAHGIPHRVVREHEEK